MTDPMLEKLVHYQRPERVLPFAQHLSAQTLAGIFGTEAVYEPQVFLFDPLDAIKPTAARRITMPESHHLDVFTEHGYEVVRARTA